MTASELARQLHGKKAGKRWQCRCPTLLHAHADRNRSLSIWQSEDGWIRLHCFTGCSRGEILAALGLTVRDLALNEFKPNPVWQRERNDRREFELLEKAWPIAEWGSVIDPNKRNYWRAAAQNSFEKWYWLRCKLEPEWKRTREREIEVQRIIKEYGFEELWNCLPNHLFTPSPNSSK
jgi:hypothetical protein